MAVKGESSSESHHNSDSQVWVSQEADYFSSSPLTSPHRSPFSIGEEDLSLGVFFSPDEGEENDVLAALRASLKAVKQTVEVVMGLRPRTEQRKEFAEILRAHDREFTTWIFDGAGILPTTRLAIRSLPLFAKLVAYIKLLKDLQMDLPYTSHAVSTPPHTKANFLRRLSSSASSQSRPRTNSVPIPDRLGSLDAQKDPRLAIIVTKVTKSFAALKESVILFAEEQKKLRASNDIMERTRKELGISLDLCLQGTRKNIKTIIKAWTDPSRSDTTNSTPALTEILPPPGAPEGQTTAVSEEPSPPALQPSKQVLVLVGTSGSGKSALTTTLACEWKRASTLGPYLFLTAPRPTPVQRSSTGMKSSGDEAEMDRPKPGVNIGHGKSLSRALSRIAKRRGSLAGGKPRTGEGDIAAFGEAVAALLASEERRKKAIIVVDGLDHADTENAKRVVALVNRAVEKDAGVKVLLTVQREDSHWLEDLKTVGKVDFIQLMDVAIQTDGVTSKTPYDPDDIRRYVTSRLPVVLTPRDQERIAEVVKGDFGDAVRICRDVEDSGAPERALDGILYREVVRKHGQEHVKVVLI